MNDTTKAARASAAAALACHLDKIAGEAEFMMTFAAEAAKGLRDGTLQPEDVARTTETMHQDPERDFDATLSFFAKPPNGIEVQEGGPSRFHLEDGAISIHTTDGVKTFGKGWLLISEPEYAELKVGYAASSTVRTFQAIAEDRRLRAGKAAYEKYVAAAGKHAGRFPAWEIIGPSVQKEWCDRAEREAEQ